MADPELEDRKKRAEKIIASPESYKVCEGCDSIVGAKVTNCPNCGSYRFDSSVERVVEQARILGSRPSRSISMTDYM
ncbi:hypothetical protein [Candidatus Methylacidithermus pantelleriae]|nr:hypothetical protein [Candidatus Methylacidithermus pantelleriae]